MVVPIIFNIVFLCPIKSWVSCEQKKSRATRQVSDIIKETSGIFDAVSLYDKLKPLTNVNPVAVIPRITFTHLKPKSPME